MRHVQRKQKQGTTDMGKWWMREIRHIKRETKTERSITTGYNLSRKYKNEDFFILGFFSLL